MKMTWFSLILFLSLTINNLSEASHHGRKLHSAVVSGTVYCDICSQEDFSKAHHFISGASVAVECKDGDSMLSFRQETKTDEHGEFKVRLPFSVTKRVKKIKRCSVKLVRSSEPYCAVASSAPSSSLNLKKTSQGTHIFSAGLLSFKPLEQPNLCNKKPSVADSKESNTKSTMEFGQPNYPVFPPPLQDPAPPQSPPLLPNLPPLPQLPPLPSLPLPPFPPIP
ncbi:olee1-like protein [Hibiscus syriacus]|uniref:olee1-like protein n=1 Tax=Hibiscus syriacus TaxID=106335 RepID=UPI001924380F|nr:olee1-like protein [Hibiscus syriacus]